jgi:hypothetical protein
MKTSRVRVALPVALLLFGGVLATRSVGEQGGGNKAGGTKPGVSRINDDFGFAVSNQLPGGAAMADAMKRGKLMVSVEINGQQRLKKQMLREGLNPLVTLPGGEKLALMCKNGRVVGPVVTDVRGQSHQIALRAATAEEVRSRKTVCIGISMTKKDGTKICIGVSIETTK